MSVVEEKEENPLKRYTSGTDRYVNFTEDILDVELLEVQKEIMREVADNRRTLVVAGNGTGKTFTVAALELAFLYTHSEATVLHTSRSNGHTRNTTYKELREMLHNAQETVGLPGYAKKQPMEIEFEDSQTRKYEAVSPSNPDGLEGRHNENFLAVVDEADKQEIDDAVIESAESSLTDKNDRMLVIGNPPRNKGNSIHRLMEDDNWHTIQFSSFDCDNVKIALGEMDGNIISGPIQLGEIKYDWEKYHETEWTSYEDILEQSARYIDEDGNYHFTECETCTENDNFREDLAEAWYRRRCGVVPPKGAAEARPFYTSDVDEAVERWSAPESRFTPSDFDAIGVDIAGRGKDETVITGVTRASQESTGRAVVLDKVSGNTETQIEQGIRHAIKGADETPIGFDSVGMGGPVADTFRNEGFNIVRFDGGKKAKDDKKYRNQRTEAWVEFGNWLHNGSINPDEALAEELFGVAEHIELTEKGLMSGTVWMATQKDDLRKASSYGASPDFLDSASIGVWALNHNASAFGDAGWKIYST